jgi:glycerol-3-phosphate dehydrogenase
MTAVSRSDLLTASTASQPDIARVPAPPLVRDPHRLASGTYDLLIVGGGIYGATAAWDATLRGLRVALVDRGDFGAGTSANSLKMIHGGFRYLRYGDIRRVRQSIRERSILLAIAPGLVRPLPVLVPITGGGPGRSALRVAISVNELISWDRNRRLPNDARIPSGRIVTANEARRLCPALEGLAIEGGAVWFDAQAMHPERLTLAFIRSAAALGAEVANRIAVTGLLRSDGRICGVNALDQMTGEAFEIAAPVTLNAAGPWSDELLHANGGSAAPAGRQALAFNIVTRFPPQQAALAVRSKTPLAEDPVCGGRRHLFLAPWRSSTLIGTGYRLLERGDDGAVRESDLLGLLAEANAACPSLRLTPDDITFHHAGRVPLREGREPGRPDALAERAQLIDHARNDGRHGLISVSGVKYTTARSVARHAIDLVYRTLGMIPPRCGTAETPLIVNGGAEDEGAAAAVRHAVRTEMALTCTDVILRRTNLGTERRPPVATVREVATVMGEELGWSDERREAEISEVDRAYRTAESR